MKVKVCEGNKELLKLINNRISSLNKKATKAKGAESLMLRFAANELDLLKLSIPGGYQAKESGTA